MYILQYRRRYDIDVITVKGSLDRKTTHKSKMQSSMAFHYGVVASLWQQKGWTDTDVQFHDVSWQIWRKFVKFVKSNFIQKVC